ncbi:MAG: DUF58 domain-containing protein [Zoogloeaceae bacterium]|jgi:uncharacterized protein (DUF58 family)|nr:DUF58 domain-containing protein [Zoogloeaceae bacterium]
MSRFFRTRRDYPQPGPIRLERHSSRLYILPTRAGFLYAVTLFAMLLTAVNYTLALGHALVFLLVSLGFVAMLHTHKNLAGLTLGVQESAPVFVGETARFQLRVEAGDRARPSLSFSCAKETTLLHLNEKTATVPLLLSASRRGWLSLPRLKVETRHPLGLFNAWTSPWLSGRCLVYPEPLFLPLPPASAIADKGGSGRSEGGEDDFSGFRERQPADSLRHVAWKAAARNDGEKPLLVKQFSGGAPEELWLSWEQTEAPENDAETRLSILTGWVIQAERNSTDYGLVLPGLRFPPARGMTHFHRCLSALALYPEHAA